MAGRCRTVEQELARIASRAHGVVTRAQLLATGISDDQIGHRLRVGGLIRVHPGVYRVGHRAPSDLARYQAAVLACGEGAALSRRAAGYLLGLVKGSPPPPQVTAPTQRLVPGVSARRCRRMDALETTTWRGVPVTTAAETLVDLAAELGEDDLARACHEAGVRYRTTPAQVELALSRRPTAAGARKLRRILHGDVRVTLSRLERRFLELLRSAGLPLPITNRQTGRYRVDCRWPEQQLTVELDGYRYHRSRHAWERDRRREREARIRGDEFRRYTFGDVFEDSGFMLAELRHLLSSQ